MYSNFKEHKSPIARKARSIKYKYDGMSGRFKMPRNSSDQTLLAVGWAFVDEATPIFADFIVYGMVARRILDGIVRNVYKHNTGKTAAWSSASHVEKAPKKKDSPTP